MTHQDWYLWQQAQEVVIQPLDVWNVEKITKSVATLDFLAESEGQDADSN